MRGRLLVALLVWSMLAVPATRAQGTEPNVYFFWSASCSYSKMARAFLLDAQQKDANLTVREFEVDQSLSNTLLLGRLYEMIGLPEFWVVPVAVIGHNVVIGYIDDETTGREILGHIAECRKTGCPDAVRKLIEQPGRFDEASAAGPVKRVGCVQDRKALQAPRAARQ
ncbi:MAG: hypothetical protein ABWY63_06495 [Hyphomicrobiaceae bacterium]|jgi:hypothetical protein